MGESLLRTRDQSTATETGVGAAALRRAVSVVALSARRRNVWPDERARDALLMASSDGVEPRARAIALDGLLSLAAGRQGGQRTGASLSLLDSWKSFEPDQHESRTNDPP